MGSANIITEYSCSYDRSHRVCMCIRVSNSGNAAFAVRRGPDGGFRLPCREARALDTLYAPGSQGAHNRGGMIGRAWTW